MIVHSGHGLQCWWCFKEPWILENENERRIAAETLHGWNKIGLEQAQTFDWELDMIFDLTRVFRVAGSINHKDSKKLKPVKILKLEPTIAYDPSHFEDFMRPLEKKVSIVPGGTGILLHSDLEPPAAKFQALCANLKKFAESWTRTRSDFINDTSGSAYGMSLASYAAQAEWSDQEIVSLLIANRRLHGDDLKLNNRSYYENTLAKARRSAELEVQRVIDKEKPVESEGDKRLRLEIEKANQVATDAVVKLKDLDIKVKADILARRAVRMEQELEREKKRAQEEIQTVDGSMGDGDPILGAASKSIADNREAQILNGDEKAIEDKFEKVENYGVRRLKGDEAETLRSKKLLLISEALGTPITRIVKMALSPQNMISRYRLSTPSKSVDIGPVPNLTEQRLFTHKLQDISGHMMPSIDKNSWRALAQQMLDICEEVYSGADGDAVASAKSWIIEYFEDMSRKISIEKLTEDQKVESRNPFTRDGEVFISLAKIKKWLKIEKNEIYTTEKIAQAFRYCRGISKSVSFRLDQHATYGYFQSRYSTQMIGLSIWQVRWSRTHQLSNVGLTGDTSSVLKKRRRLMI